MGDSAAWAGSPGPPPLVDDDRLRALFGLDVPTPRPLVDDDRLRVLFGFDLPAIGATAGLAVLLGEHWEALDFDFRAHLGLDLEDCCWGPGALGVRRLKGYISRLPADSAIAREMGWSWDQMRDMTATLIEVMVNQHRKKGTEPWRYPRPDAVLEAAAKAAEANRPPLSRAAMRAALHGG